MTAGSRLAAALDLSPLPSEGGWFRQTFADENFSTILFLVADGEFSALHRLTAPEEYIFLAGSPLTLLLLDSGGSREVVLDREHPQVVVAPGTWQGSSSVGDWTLVTTKVTPAFDWAMFELADRTQLQAQWPGTASRIEQLTRIEA